MTRRRFIVLLLGLLSVGVLAACGGSTPAPGEKVTVTTPRGVVEYQVVKIEAGD